MSAVKYWCPGSPPNAITSFESLILPFFIANTYGLKTTAQNVPEGSLRWSHIGGKCVWTTESIRYKGCIGTRNKVEPMRNYRRIQ